MSVTIRGSGQIVQQVVSATKTDMFATTSTSYVDVTGVTVNITPSSASSKMLVMVTGYFGGGGGANGFAYGIVLRNGTTLPVGDARGSAQQTGMDLSVFNAGNITDAAHSFAYTYLDSPATTSSITYKLQVKATVNTLNIGGSNSTSDGNRSNTPTMITVMEISGA